MHVINIMYYIECILYTMHIVSVGSGDEIATLCLYFDAYASDLHNSKIVLNVTISAILYLI